MIVTTKTFGQVLKDTVVDIDGNVYQTVRIGTQIWMVENLNVTHYSNGEKILNISPDTLHWSIDTTAHYFNYNNDSAISIDYGRLYNWYTVNDNRKICPVGWHIPSDSEWTILINYLGGENEAGGKMKEKGTLHWISPNIAATNSSKFTAIPCGAYFENKFDGAGGVCMWWTSTELTYGSSDAWCRYIIYSEASIHSEHFEKSRGFSVRCVKN